MSVPTCTILEGDVLAMLKTLPDESVQCVVTSPPYWALRDYGTDPQAWGGDPLCEHEWGPERIKRDTRGEDGSTLQGRKNIRVGRDWDPTAGESKVKRDYSASVGCFCTACGAWRGELGLEPTPELYVEHIVEVFREVRRVLKRDGTLWLNLGDCYNAYNGGAGPSSKLSKTQSAVRPQVESGYGLRHKGLKPKDLVGIPWRVAFALQADGWYLRRDIIWAKPNPMPESVTDRPTTAHEYIFLLSKGEKYVYDAAAVAEPGGAFTKMPDGWDTGLGAHGSIHRNGREKGKKTSPASQQFGGPNSGMRKKHYPNNSQPSTKPTEGRFEPRAVASGRMGREPGWRNNTPDSQTRNRRSVWTIATAPYPEAHFATFPREIPRVCILAGSRPGDMVIDPFGGSGTTGEVALELGRSCTLIELQGAYIPLIRNRVAGVTPGFVFDEVPA